MTEDTMSTKPAHICDLMGRDSVIASLQATDKKQLLQALAAHAAARLGLEEHAVFDVLWEREKLGTTGVGQGIAIPHGRLAGIGAVQGFFARLTSPIAFDSVDDCPVDLVFMLLAPQSAGADHLHALAAVSKALRDNALCERIRRVKKASEILALLTQASNAKAA